MRSIVISICLSLVSAACGHHGQLSETVPEETALSYPALVPSEVISSEFRDAPKSDINHADLKARAARLHSRAKDLALAHTSASDSGNWTDGNSH